MTPSKQEILHMAAECFMEQGFHATSIDDVARRLGATKGRVYHHYPSKIELFFDVHRAGMELLFSAVEPASKLEGDGITILTAMLHAHAMAVLEHHTFESVVAQGVQMHRFGATTPTQRTILDELINSRDQFEAMFKKAAMAARKDGTLANVDISVAVKTLLGGIQWSLIWYRPEADTGPRSRRVLADQMVKTLVDGVKARAEGATRSARGAKAKA
ncbi:MAG: Transcriptional regulator, AcrR family [uncultured Paraburkholderia sp.]|uniref:TetR/AcrR family transcriptional regulator n=1 Tax=uncultured Paraburkholderia sp. TaxID=1822466 RepID=UPI002598B1E0|nr:TetR/AcrR family transcriptional regulator [uncultured Paraburkholderia sp.]CAH2904179.1 MAG: Transcriptional regulator, AcrR family [uncultured Paraburkholderia sp.]CAH2942702.1 MAG: Transcriptional regulator, AcrR family [uncultured Paraburkholderia sp.]